MILIQVNEIMKTFYVPQDEFFIENFYSLFCSNGYASDPAETQRLLLEQINQSNNNFIKITVEQVEKGEGQLPIIS